MVRARTAHARSDLIARSSSREAQRHVGGWLEGSLPHHAPPPHHAQCAVTSLPQHLTAPLPQRSSSPPSSRAPHPRRPELERGRVAWQRVRDRMGWVGVEGAGELAARAPVLLHPHPHVLLPPLRRRLQNRPL
eukprot:1033385-Rhodomonas_salina.1